MRSLRGGHCEERSDEAIFLRVNDLTSPSASAARRLLRFARNDVAFTRLTHCLRV